ncbi:MAG: site-2 protease family protein [Minisyncoccia bacterium]
MDPILVAFQITILVFAVIIHEVSHGVVALSLGDPTAKLSGRLTLNPIPHIDIYGSIILPLLMGLASGGAFVFGYAKPVPFNPYLLRDQKWAPALVALAGPASNLALAIFLGVSYRIAVIFTNIPAEIGQLFGIAVVINIVLAVFNSVPIPPLDGSKIIAPLLPDKFLRSEFYAALEQQGMWIVLIFVFFGFGLISPIIARLANLIIG